MISMASSPGGLLSRSQSQQLQEEEQCVLLDTSNPLEICSCLSVVSLAVGVFLIGTGYLYPRDYDFNPDMPAREMEKIEIYYADLGDTLDICIMVGLVFVGVSGMLMAGIVIALIWSGGIDPPDDMEIAEVRTESIRLQNRLAKQYGTNSNQQCNMNNQCQSSH